MQQNQPERMSVGGIPFRLIFVYPFFSVFSLYSKIPSTSSTITQQDTAT